MVMDFLSRRSLAGQIARAVIKHHVIPRFLPYLAERLGTFEGQAEAEAPTSEAEELWLKSREFVKALDGAVTLLIGTRFTGKTVLAYRLAEYYARPTYAISPEQPPPYWVTRIGFSEIDSRVKPMSTLVCDDLPAYASNRDYNNELSERLERLIPMVRHERKIQLIFCTQSTAQADKYVMDCEMALFKPLGVLFEGYERQAILKIYRDEVNPYFAGKGEDWLKRHAWVRSRGGYIGGIEINKTD